MAVIDRSPLDRGTCRTLDPDAMYPNDKDTAGKARAKAICAACPVKSQCLEIALRSRERWGVWGGLDEDERRRLLKASSTMQNVEQAHARAC